MRMLALILVTLASTSIDAQQAFDRGQSVRVRAPKAESRAVIALKIVAVPGDRVRVVDDRVYVNDTAVTGFTPEFLERVAAAPRVPDVVPAGHYFVMGERRSNDDIAEYWGVHAVTSLERVP